MTLTLGLERMLDDPAAWVQPGHRVGLLSNPTGVDRRLRSTVDLLLSHADIDLVHLYGPEHGIRGDAQAGVAVADDVDPRTGLPATSLYSGSHGMAADAFNDVDVLVIDLQDAGVRYYTYLATANSATRRATEAGRRVVVLDRPNPIAWMGLFGNRVAPGAGSIVGLEGLPIAHGATIGEMLVHLARRDGRVPPDVVTMTGWDRSMRWQETRLPWVPPSPNLPTLDTVHLYPASCLIEGTSLSEGRGTTLPFQVVGAPGLDHHALAERLSRTGTEGYLFRPMTFVPSFSKHEGEPCHGVQIHPVENHHPSVMALGPRLLAAVRDLAGEIFAWTQFGERYFIDRLGGGPALRETIDAGGDVDAMLVEWHTERDAFVDAITPDLIYGPLIRQETSA